MTLHITTERERKLLLDTVMRIIKSNLQYDEFDRETCEKEIETLFEEIL